MSPATFGFESRHASVRRAVSIGEAGGPQSAEAENSETDDHWVRDSQFLCELEIVKGDELVVEYPVELEPLCQKGLAAAAGYGDVEEMSEGMPDRVPAAALRWW